MVRTRWIAIAIVGLVCGRPAVRGAAGRRTGPWRLSASRQAGPAPRTADASPTSAASGLATRREPCARRNGFDSKRFAPFRPGGEELFYEPRTGDPRHDEPRAFCMPSGFPSNLFGPYPVQIVQRPGWLVMVHEFMRMTRLIPLDGRPHRDVEPTYHGDPVGRWKATPW